MKVIYENQVKAAGECVEEFKDAGMFIIFGENAPDEIKDYCYSVSVNPINGEIAPGQYVVIDGAEFKITCVGYEAPITLKGLGHCTFNFSGATEAELPGTIYVEAKPMPGSQNRHNPEDRREIRIFPSQCSLPQYSEHACVRAASGLSEKS